MKISTRARYGMRAMLDMASQKDGGLVLLKDIAARQDVSKRYLEHMMTRLRNQGLVVSERGASGGYRLARDPADIRLDEIFEALEGEIAPVECVRDTSACERSEDCVTRDLWCDLAEAMRSVLSGQTLADLELRRRKAAADSQSPRAHG
jgi:Rrf2 family protein